MTDRGSQIMCYPVLSYNPQMEKVKARDTEETKTYCVWQDLCLLSPLWVYGQYCLLCSFSLT